MSKHKLEVFLKGEFTTIDVKIEGEEMSLREVEDNVYFKTFDQFEIDNPLNINVLLKGFITMDWELDIKVDGNSIFLPQPPLQGTFDSKGFISFAQDINLFSQPTSA